MSFLEQAPSPSSERFTLLLLEPGEIYFEDFSAYYYPPTVPASQYMKKRQRGRLKICSKSIVFDPVDSDHPIIKFHFKHISDIEQADPALQLRISSECLTVNASQTVEMREKNLIAPYRFVKETKTHLFSLKFVRVDDCLPQMCQLHRAASLPLNDQNIMIGAIIKGRQNRVKFDTTWLDDLSEQLLLEVQADHIQPLVTNPGRLMLTSSILYFQPINNIYPLPVIKIPLSKISCLTKRRYVLQHIGLELYAHSRSKSQMYLSFKTPRERDALYDLILSQPGVELEPCDPGDMMLRWQNGDLSNYDYLLYLNSLGDRSFNDLTQYPIMPWVIADYTSTHLDLASDPTFRDLTKPIGALNPNRLIALKERFNEMPDPKFLYGSHYSTPGFVLFYLVRVAPEYMLCLQNGRFDHPDRMFNSIADTWTNCLTGHSDFKELIPEFYDVNACQFLSHDTLTNFGMRSDRRPVSDVELPPWASSPRDFVEKLRESLESDWVSHRLHHWIDLVFGWQQRGQAAMDADNVFYYLTYEGAVDASQITDTVELASLEAQIMEFGQTPKQLFTKPHPQRLSPLAAVPRSLPPSPRVVDNDNPAAMLDVGEEDGVDVTDTMHLTREGREGATPEPASLTLSSARSLQPHLSHTLHREAVTAVAVSGDGRHIFSVSQDGVLKMYSMEDQTQVRSITFSTMALSCLSVLPDDSVILVGSWDNNVYVYSVEYGQTLHTLGGHDDAVSCLISTDKQLITASWDSTVKVWNMSLATHKQKTSIDLMAELDHDYRVTCLDYSRPRESLVTGTDGGTVHLWDMKTSHPLLDYHAHHGMVTGVLFISEYGRLVSCGSDANLKMWDSTTGTEVYTRDLARELLCMTLAASCLLLGTTSGDVIVCDPVSGQQHGTIHAHHGDITCLCVKGDKLVTGSDDGRVTFWKHS